MCYERNKMETKYTLQSKILPHYTHNQQSTKTPQMEYVATEYQHPGNKISTHNEVPCGHFSK